MPFEVVLLSAECHVAAATLLFQSLHDRRQQAIQAECPALVQREGRVLVQGGIFEDRGAARNRWLGHEAPPYKLSAHAGSCPRPSERLALERFAQVDRMSHRGIELIAMELAFPATDDDGGQAIADQIGQRTALAHELV